MHRTSPTADSLLSTLESVRPDPVSPARGRCASGAPGPRPAPPRTEVGPLGRLAPWPEVRAELRARGVVLAALSDEDEETFENRLGTALMAYYRDTRSEVGFEALYAFARAAVLRWIRSLLHRGARYLDPTDLLQDTFVNVFRYPGGFRDDHTGSFRVWVRTIAANIVRRSSARTSLVSFQELPDGCQEPSDATIGPELQAIAGEEVERLREAWMLFLVHYARAWSQLAPRDRLALRLVELEGLSYQAAGRILRVRHSNMKMIVFRSRKRIAHRMRGALRAARQVAHERREAALAGAPRLAG